MTAVSTWVAAGSSAALLAAGLFLGAPTAAAAPGSDACLQASTRFEAALSAAGITEASIARIDSLAEATAAAEAAYLALVEAAAAGPAADLEAAEATLDAAVAATAAAQAALEEAQASGDADAVAAAEAAKEAADAAEDDARQAVTDLTAAYEAAINTPEILEAQDAFDAALAEFETALNALSLDEASATNLMRLFDAFLGACNPDAIGVEPVLTQPVSAPGSLTPTATNKGLNVQTAAQAEPATHPGLALLAGLVAAGIAVPSAAAIRMRRLARSHK